MKVLITGGAGFIGLHLARRLVASGAQVTAIDLLTGQVHRDPAAAAAAFPGPVVVGDIADPEVWRRMHRPDAVIHLAAETGTAQSMYEQDRYARTNVEGTRLVGEAVERWQVPLVAVSSRAVYGEGRYECPVDGTSVGGPCCDQAHPVESREHDAHAPVSVYGQTKSVGESLLSEVGRRVPVSIVRPQNVVGPGQALHNPYTGVLAAFLAHLREGSPLVVYGDGTATRDFVHVDDVSALLHWCLRHDPQVGGPRVLNSGTGTRTSLLDVARAAVAASPAGPATIEFADVRRVGDIAHACADLSRVAAAAAPLPRWTSEAAIVDFVRRSWQAPGAGSQAWTAALAELAERGLTDRGTDR